MFVIIGILVGFIGGYLAHEAMSARQPVPASRILASQEQGQVRVPAGQQAAAAQPAGGVPTAEIDRLRQHVAQNPDDSEAIILLANLNFEIQNWSRAAELYARFLELQPGDPDAMTDLGVCYRETQRYEEALALFREARAVQPDHWQSRYNEVVVLAFDLRRPDDANELLTELRELQPDNPSVSRLVEEIEKLRPAA